ncbi:hypothetical protein KEJ45_01285 [Candidatus Bathyarchaeota archaeon]|nr:hypothetical protein [Candidatus Bathyarchaeota archaeon]
MKIKVIIHTKLRGNKKAISPAVSTVILTSAIVVLLLVTVVFANNFLNARMAENEFSAMEQFMQSVGLQLDDVAWTAGRVQTFRYASRFGQMAFENKSLTYNVYINGALWQNFTTGIIMFKMPVEWYSLGNNHYKSIYPQDGRFIHWSASAPVGYVYAVERLPMADGGFIRVVLVPTIRVLNSTMTIGSNTYTYLRFYLPQLFSNGTHNYLSQSITFTGERVLVKTATNVNTVRITVSFPNSTRQGEPYLNGGFFNFAKEEETFSVQGSIIEFYTGEVKVSLGLHA